MERGCRNVERLLEQYGEKEITGNYRILTEDTARRAVAAVRSAGDAQPVLRPYDAEGCAAIACVQADHDRAEAVSPPSF